MKLAIVYAGQGSQHPGMGQDLYEGNAVFQKTWDACNAVDFDLKEVCFKDSHGLLNQTAYTQPCMVAFQTAMTAVLENLGILEKADYVAGLSLGEYSALQAAGLWTPSDAVKIAAFRGQAMTESAEGVDCGMTAIIGLKREELEPLLEENCFITNDNCPSQLVISGERTSVEKTSEKAKEAGAMKVVPLKVSGPFHTPYMKKAGEKLAKFLPTMAKNGMKKEVVYNFLGRPEADADVTDLLVNQVQNGVRMRESLIYLLEQGVDTFVEVGPGKTLSGFVKRTAKALEKENGLPNGLKSSDIKTYVVETAEDLDALRGVLYE
jgi:[acyl-carrier-protein] S-malonyltransferase